MVNGTIRIAHMTLWVTIGGLERLVVEICKSLDSQEFEVQVLCLIDYDPACKKTLDERGIRVHLIRKGGRFDYSYFLRIVSFLKGNRIDVVHSHSGCLFDSALCARLAKVQGILYTAHGMPVEFGLRAKLKDRIGMSLVDNVVAVSGQIHEDLVRRFPSQSQKVMEIQNGVDTELFRPDSDPDSIEDGRRRYGIPTGKTIIGTVGRLDTVKNYGCLIRAFARLYKAYDSNIHLVLVGAGNERVMLEDLARVEGVGKSVTFLGIQYEIHKILPLFDMFVLSSVTEGTSVSLLEAQSCGIPAVVTDVGGNGNIITDYKNGLLCKVNDDVDLAEKLDILVRDWHLARRMGQYAREVVKDRFSLNTMVARYEHLYRDLASAGTPLM